MKAAGMASAKVLGQDYGWHYMGAAEASVWIWEERAVRSAVGQAH